MPSITLDEVRAWDNQDPLREHRSAFALPPGVIYLDGNSLGPLCHEAAARLAHVTAAEWGTNLIRSWTDAGWMEAPTRIGDQLAPLIGARPGEVLAADSTTVNLFKIAAAAAALRPGRTTLLTETGNFPTDRHVLDGLARLVPNLRVRAVPPEDLAAALDETTAALILCHVHYRTGRCHDMAALSAAAHRVGALALWDLSHSVGAIPVALNDDGADMAVGCGYKFLNGGPGAPAFLYVAEQHQAAASTPVQGWMGHLSPFGFNDVYEHGAGISRFRSGTPPILGLAALEAGITTFLRADRAQLWQKSARMFALFAALVPHLECLTPTDPAERGSHIAFSHPRAETIMSALIARSTIGDFRPPDILRFGLTPLYTRYEDIWMAAEAVREEGK
jgi:kynureninase